VSSKQTKRDPERFFQTDDVKASLGQKSVRGGLAIGGGQAIRFSMQMVLNVILARLLAPEEFGIVAMVVAIFGFLLVMKDLGLTNATIQKPDITHAQSSNLFWINAAFSVIVVSLLMLASPWMASFYGQPEVQQVTIWIALSFLPIGLSSQHRAILARQMRFQRIMLVENTAIGTGVAVAIISAFMGASYWSLVLYHIVQGVLLGVGSWITCGWIPGLPKRNADVRSLLAFGGNMLGYNIINYASRNVDQILIGKFIGPIGLGFYERAFKLVVQPMAQIQTPLARISLPTLSRLIDEPDRYRSYYRRAVGLLGLIVSPILALTVVMADELVGVVFGPGWEQTASLFAILAISAIFTPYSFTSGWLLASQDRMPEMLRMGIVTSLVSVSAIATGLNWGAEGVAWAIVLSTLFIRIPFQFWVAGRKGHVSIREMYSVVPFPIMIAGIVALTSFTTKLLLTTGINAVDLAIAVIASATTATITLLITPRGRQVFAELRNIRNLLGGK
jgi:O-antigen/teichoic acid export membrane protein